MKPRSVGGSRAETPAIPSAACAGAGQVAAMLAGGNRRSLGRADEAAALTNAGAIPFAVLFGCIFSDDPVVAMRAIDAVEKVTATAPDRLVPHRQEFLAAMKDFGRPEMRWHAALLLPRLGLSGRERDEIACPLLQEYLADESRIVRTCALQALAEFALADAALRPRVTALLDAAVNDGSPAVRARSRRLLQTLRRAGAPPAPASHSAGGAARAPASAW